MHTDTAQEFVRAIFNEQQRIGARQHKQAQRESRMRAALKKATAEVARLQAQAETVQGETAAVYERLLYALTGHGAVPDAAFVHDLFEHWQERWNALSEKATALRQASDRDAH